MSGRLFEAVCIPAQVDLGEATWVDASDARIRYPDLTEDTLEAVCSSLIAAGEPLRARPVRELAEWLGHVGERFLDLSDALREEALRHLPATTGLSAEMCAAVVDGVAADWTEPRLLALLERELGDPGLLDGFVSVREDKLRAMGPSLTVQIVSGSVPGVGATALIRSLLLKSPTLVKPGAGDSVLPVLFARALAEADESLASGLAVLYWPGGRDDLELAALASADGVVVYGGDETVSSVRTRTPVTARFVGYHHRVSIGVVGREALDEDHVGRVAADVAGAVGFFDRRGCVSPQVVYVEAGGEIEAREFARRLADAFASLQRRLPAGALGALEAAGVQQLRGTAHLLAESGTGVEVHDGGDLSWTVVFESDGPVGPACAGRVVRVREVSDSMTLGEEMRPVSGHLQTVGIAGLGARVERISEILAASGASRIAPFDTVAFPPPWWHHDGGGPLRDLVRWVDLVGG